MIDFFELRENKIFFVKVGDGRDSMTVKVKADNKSAAVKKMKAKYPKYPVSLDRNQKQGKPAGALESVEESVKTEDKGQFIYAAKQAKAKGDSTFVFAGKTYNCEEVLENEDLDEAFLETVATIWLAKTVLPYVIGVSLITLGVSGLGLIKMFEKFGELRRKLKDKRMQAWVKKNKGKKLDSESKAELDKIITPAEKKKIRDEVKDVVKKEQVEKGKVL